uniref:InfA n=1 Tax=Veratrum mengtzeanum TaxID=203098 RepID=A0A649X5Q6_9LILI|nr:InfA [Veratrum mengtzeanum]YP_010309100.1 InfA [Veratrum stenophyllum]QGL08954.1 InfA [Veratrum mengtzeanum]QSV09078.1 InfA [Veratrum taliense]QSV09248.1 InfA [Veratrum stenophyllum]
MKEQKLIHEGLITESLPNGMFRVRLDNEDLILGRVKIEVSCYDSPRGSLIYRLRNKDSNDSVIF